jgi:hypothetical protein
MGRTARQGREQEARPDLPAVDGKARDHRITAAAGGQAER